MGITNTNLRRGGGVGGVIRSSNGGGSCVSGCSRKKLILLGMTIAFLFFLFVEVFLIHYHLITTPILTTPESSNDLHHHHHHSTTTSSTTYTKEYMLSIIETTQSIPKIQTHPPKCTIKQLLSTRYQLLPEFCIHLHTTQNLLGQSCSLTVATQCPDSTRWLHSFYMDLQIRIMMDIIIPQQQQEHNRLSTSIIEEEEVYEEDEDEEGVVEPSKLSPPSTPFLGISIGCNKGFDAIQTLKMLSFDSTISKESWKHAMISDGSQLSPSKCQQDIDTTIENDTILLNSFQSFIREQEVEGFKLLQQHEQQEDDETTTISSSSSSSSSSTWNKDKGEMHCIEPIPQTYERLLNSSQVLGYDRKGFVVTNAAISKHGSSSSTNRKDMTFFVTGGLGNIVGVEHKSMENSCQDLPLDEQERMCQLIPVYSLKEYLEEFVTPLALPSSSSSLTPLERKGEEVEEEETLQEFPNINILSINAEGFDGDILLGGIEDGILHKVEYLEFEYNWMGSWSHQHLYDIISKLDDNVHMTCYWAGKNKLWRITDCWMRYYDIHVWSNVACVNRQLVPKLAYTMEDIYQSTLMEEKPKQWMRSDSTRIQKHFPDVQEEVSDHILMSIEDEVLTQAYI